MPFASIHRRASGGHGLQNVPRLSYCTSLISILISWHVLLSAAEDFDEGPSELDVEGGVDDGVKGTVDIPQPGESAVKFRRHVACPAVGVQNVSHKKRQPADEEHPWSRKTAEPYGRSTGSSGWKEDKVVKKKKIEQMEKHEYQISFGGFEKSEETKEREKKRQG